MTTAVKSMLHKVVQYFSRSNTTYVQKIVEMVYYSLQDGNLYKFYKLFSCYSVHKNCIITLYERELCSTILPGKNCVLLNSVQEFIEIEAWLLLTSFIKFYAFYCQILKNKMLEKGGSSNRQKKRLLLSPSFTTKFVFVFVLSQESAFS